MPWIEIGLKINHIYDDNGFNWRDGEVLKNFKLYGLDKYSKINIWYIDWEIKRQKALKLGLKDVPINNIVDPRSLSTRLAHILLMKHQMYPFWRIDFIRLALSKGPKIIKRIFA